MPRNRIRVLQGVVNNNVWEPGKDQAKEFVDDSLQILWGIRTLSKEPALLSRCAVCFDDAGQGIPSALLSQHCLAYLDRLYYTSSDPVPQWVPAL